MPLNDIIEMDSEHLRLFVSLEIDRDRMFEILARDAQSLPKDVIEGLYELETRC